MATESKALVDARADSSVRESSCSGMASSPATLTMKVDIRWANSELIIFTSDGVAGPEAIG